MRHTRSEGQLLRCTLSLGALLLWRCTDGDDVMSSGIGGSAGNAAGAMAGIGGAATGPLPVGNTGSAGWAGTTGGSSANGGGGAGALGGAGAAGTGNMPPTAGASAGNGGVAAGAGGAAGSGGAAGEPAMPSSGCGTADVPPSGTVEIEVRGTPREFVVAVPSGYDPDHPYRLALAWHGLGGTAMQAVSAFGLASASEDSAIFIAGQALEAQSGQQAGFASWATDGTDTDYARALIDWAKALDPTSGNRAWVRSPRGSRMGTRTTTCRSATAR
jgi:hypothetical protein